MFRKKKLYKIKYHMMASYTILIEAVDECQAIRKFRRKMGDRLYSIDSIEEYTVGRG